MGGPREARHVEAVVPGSQVDVGDQGGQDLMAVDMLDGGRGAVDGQDAEALFTQKFAVFETANEVVVDE